MRVGLVEDNVDFRAELAFHLRRADIEVVLESDGVDIDSQLGATRCDILILDLGLPAEDGLQIARRLRKQQPELGLVMLTARTGLEHRLLGLDHGADAYLAKPIDMRELVATLNSVERRLFQVAAAPDTWLLVPSTLTLQPPQGQGIIVNPSEMTLLQSLAEVAPAAVPRERLAVALGHVDPEYDYRRLEVAFSRLRRKIETACAVDPPIRSARGRGYVFGAPIRIVRR